MPDDEVTTRPVTMQDVAAAAGVSAQTVSRVINAKPDVAEATRKRVMETIQRLGYRSNAVARSLVSSRTRALGVIITLQNDPFAAEVIAGAEAEARRRGYVCIVTYTDGTSEAVRNRCRLLEERQVDGLLLVAPGAVPHDAVDLCLPSVALAYPVMDAMATNVDVDNLDGAYQAITHLTSLGHRRIGIVAGPEGWRAATDRIEGGRRALAAAGLSVEECPLKIAAEWTMASGHEAVRAIMDSHPETTALFCHNDMLAIGAYRLLRERGLTIPHDMSVVGYDDLAICSFLSPSLTSVRQPRVALGQLLVQLLIDTVERRTSSGQDVLVRAELVVRESTGPPRSR
ncbi:MAG TPA: LacI family transcriptional regulator [Candidatus Hydrogenedentes bacterium]|nr:LacI family transcriptional regulator [Candidatus Hydrogenedentota bacterium]